MATKDGWPLKTTDTKRLESFEKRCMKKIKLPPLNTEATIQEKRIIWLEHVLITPEKSHLLACLEFEKADTRKRRPDGVKYTWRKIVRKELQPHLKPPKIHYRKWDKEWLVIAKETAASRYCWNTLVPDITHMAGNEQ